MNIRRAEFRFYAELNDFLPRHLRFTTIVRLFDRDASVKDMIEAVGVPHAEVDLVTANSEPVDFTYRVRDGDRIAVYPMFEAFDIGPVVRVRPEPLRDPRFAADAHLGRLARHLRLLGFDTTCERDWRDADLAAHARAERRIVLTRDVGLLKRRIVTHGIFVRARQPDAQLLEIVRRVQLGSAFQPFTRCMTCNGLLARVTKEEVEGHVPEHSWHRYDRFMRCLECKRVYWHGTHYERLSHLVDEIRTAVSEQAEPTTEHAQETAERGAALDEDHQTPGSSGPGGVQDGE
jgi:uncharacterized protein